MLHVQFGCFCVGRQGQIGLSRLITLYPFDKDIWALHRLWLVISNSPEPVLALAYNERSEIKDLPTWIPRWRLHRDKFSIHRRGRIICWQGYGGRQTVGDTFAAYKDQLEPFKSTAFSGLLLLAEGPSSRSCRSCAKPSVDCTKKWEFAKNLTLVQECNLLPASYGIQRKY